MLSRIAPACGLSRRSWTAPIALCLAALVTGCGSSDPIVLHPKTPGVTVSQCPLHHGAFMLARVEDKRGYADASNVGFTQTGMFNVKASLETDRPAARVVQDALLVTMRRCGMLADSPAARPLTVDLLALQISEQTGFTSETMTGDLRYEVIALDPGADHPLSRFAVTGHSQHSGIDTTDFAEQTISESIASSLPSFLRNLSALPESSADAPPPVPVAGDGSPDVTTPIRVTLRPLTEDEQRTRFGTTLADKQVLAVEIHIERAGTVAHDLRFHRQDFRLTFASGGARFPLDPTKVRERNRISFPLFAYGGIVPIYMGEMNMSADTKGLASTVEQLTMPSGMREVRGTLFFDLEGAASRPMRMDLSYEDLITHESQGAIAPYTTP